MAATDSMPVPKKGVAFRLYFTVRDAAGDPVTGFTSPDSEVSLDGAAFADCTNEATFVGHGNGYIDLTTSEMNADSVCFYMSCSEGSIDIAIAPEEAGDIRSRADLDTIKTNPVVNAGTVTFPTGATLASTTNITAGTITTTTNLTNAPSDSAGVTTLLSRLSALRAGYLDNLSAGAVALEASVQGLITTIGASAAGVAAAVWGAVTRTITGSVTVSDKTGFKLASDGLDSISTTAPSGLASNFREMIVQTWRRWFKKTTMVGTTSSGTFKTYANDGSTVLTTETYTDAGGTATKSDAA
jgi:hypothetical protein